MKSRCNRSTGLTIKGIVATCVLASPFYCANSFSETRGFAVSFFHAATYKDEQNCTLKDRYSDLMRKSYDDFFTDEERKQVANDPLDCLTDLTVVAMRGRIKGKLASVYHYPGSAKDPGFQMHTGPYAYGFNLDGEGADNPDAFQDPETGEKGVDNQMYRALGCFSAYNISLPNRPRHEDIYWRRAANRKYGAWIFTITADDLSKDGEATVSFYRSLNHLRQDVSGMALSDTTYVIDPSPRTFGKFKGVIKDGVFISNASGVDFRLATENRYYPAVDLAKAQLRLRIVPESRSAEGFIGGYQPWKQFWHRSAESNEANTSDLAATYHNLKKAADAQPDPETGENTAISITYRIESVPAFIATPDGTMVTSTGY